MPKHVSSIEMMAFILRIGSAAEMAFVGEHIARCDSCNKLFRETSREFWTASSNVFNLAASYWLKDEHLKYEHKAAYADDLLDGDEREMLSEHLGLCKRCREDLDTFLTDRRENEPELPIRYEPSEARWPIIVFKKLSRSRA